MRILLISNMYPSNIDPHYGVFVKNFKDKMEAQGIDVTPTALISGRGKNKFEKTVKYLKFFKDVISAVKQNQYDLIYVHYINHSLLPLLLVQKYLTKPLVLNAHGSDVFVNNRIGKYIQNLVTPIIKKADMIVVPSSFFSDVIHNKFCIDKKNIFVSPSGGIDTELFKPTAETKSGKPFTIGYVSRIDKGKGWDVLLAAIRLLNEKDINNFEVLLIGSGSQEKELADMVKQYQLQSKVKIVGVVPHTELAYWYNQMDVFVFPTQLTESLGLVGLEAMACGVPVIGSDIGGLRGYIDNASNGDLFEPGNIDELSKKIKKFMLMDKNKLKQYSIHSLATAKQYDSSTVSKNMCDKLQTIVKLCHKKGR